MIGVIAAREFRALFGAPLAWVVLGLMQLLFARIFLLRLDAFLQEQAQLALLPDAPGATAAIVAPLFSGAAFILMMAVPLLSMRLIAGERRGRTLPLLLSSPVSPAEIVLGKYLGLMGFLAAAVALPAVMSLSLLAGAPLDLGLLASNALGLLLLAAAFGAVGVFCSALFAHPLAAGVATLAVLLTFMMMNTLVSESGPVQFFLSLVERYGSFYRGMLDSADLAYLVAFTALFLALAVRRIEALRLRG